MHICAIYLSIYLSNYFFRTCIERFGRTPRVECRLELSHYFLYDFLYDDEKQPGKSGHMLITKILFSSSADCSLVSTKCPEHDCLPGRQGKTLCTWITY